MLFDSNNKKKKCKSAAIRAVAEYLGYPTPERGRVDFEQGGNMGAAYRASIADYGDAVVMVEVYYECRRGGIPEGYGTFRVEIDREMNIQSITPMEKED